MSDAPAGNEDDALPIELLAALVERSRDLLALTDAVGTLVWANARFAEATGYVPGSAGASLLDYTPQGSAGTSTRLAFAEMLSDPDRQASDVEMRGEGERAFWVDARAVRLDKRVAWSLVDVSRAHALEAKARHLGELLEITQEFGRLGVWEREIPSGKGRWDAHVFGFWGLDPDAGTPAYEEAIQRIHPEDRARMTYAETTRRAGRYAQRYRVEHPDGRTRWIHSQWAVKNGPLGTPDRTIGVMVDDTEAFEQARALSAANAQLGLAVDLGRIVIWRHDLASGRMRWSDRGYELLGLQPRPGDFTIDEIRALIHPDDVAMVMTSAREALRADRPTDVEARYRHVDGRWRYVLSRRVVERRADGEPIAFVGVAFDVTDRVVHLRRADELARRLDSASRASGVGIWTTATEPAETDWNEQMFVLFDLFEGRGAPTLGEWLRVSVHPADRDRVAAASLAVLRGAPTPFELEFRSLRRNGDLRWIVIRASADLASAPRRRLLGVAMDVTDHHLALDALRDASARASLIARHAGIGMWEAGIDSAPERWDDQMFTLRGLPVRDKPPDREERLSMVHPDDLPLVLDSNVGRAHAPTSYEFRVRMPDGGWRWLASRSAVIGGADGRPTRRVGVNWDVTESKTAEVVRQQAELANRAMEEKTRFLSRMSHELRTPLNAVLGFTQLLQVEARRAGDRGQLDKLGHIRAAGQHLLSLINDVLDLSGLESGDVRLEAEPVSIAALVDETVPLVESMAAQQAVRIEKGALEGAALADRTRLRQILINLLSNAIKYNRPGGSVRIEARVHEGRVEIAVADDGRGLEPEQIAGLFEPFNRFGAEREGIEGTGIGLTIVKALVDGMNGRIDVASRPGIETVFRVALPMADVPAVDTGTVADDGGAVAAATLAARERRSGTILYIEDNPVNVLLVEELVKTLGGLAIVSEATGLGGVERARQLAPDLVLVDLQLPDIDGYDVLQRLRAHGTTRSIPAIALSANAMPEDIQRGLEAGFADYWTKPIDFARFIAAIRERFPAESSLAGVDHRASA